MIPEKNKERANWKTETSEGGTFYHLTKSGAGLHKRRYEDSNEGEEAEITEIDDS